MQPLNKIAVVFGIIALVGFADASYLTAEHYRGVVPPCSIVSGCETVLTSRYAAVLGIPVSVGGMAFYGALLLLTLAFFDSRNEKILRGAAWLSIIGFGGTLYFVVLQVFILHALCLYCMGSAVTSTILMLLGIRILRSR